MISGPVDGHGGLPMPWHGGLPTEARGIAHRNTPQAIDLEARSASVTA